MARAIAPTEFPPLPEGATQWRMSARRGSVFHAIDALGASVCGSIRLERHKSILAHNLGDMQYWGCCPRCHAKAVKGALT